MKAFSYLRVSGLGQVQGDGFTRQRESILKYAQAHGMEISMEFIDEGVSGTIEGVNRRAWNDMMACILANGVRTILVERSDRLARDLVVGELMLRRCRELVVKVIETEGGSELTVESKEPTQVLIRQILGAVAEFDRCITVQKLKAARIRAKAKNGRCEGGKPFGEKPGEKEIVDFVLQLASEDKTLKEIAYILNAQGHKTRYEGKKWHPTSVMRILKREKNPLALSKNIPEIQKRENSPVDSLDAPVVCVEPNVAAVSVGE